jgi:hypothetical protein
MAAMCDIKGCVGRVGAYRDGTHRPANKPIRVGLCIGHRQDFDSGDALELANGGTVHR